MVRKVRIFGIGITVVAAFIFGRMSVETSLIQEGETIKVSEIDAAYRDFIDAQTDTLDFFKSQDFF